MPTRIFNLINIADYLRVLLTIIILLIILLASANIIFNSDNRITFILYSLNTK